MSDQPVNAPLVKLSKDDRELLALMASDSPYGSVTYSPGRWHETNAEDRTRYKFERWQPAAYGLKLYVRVTAPVDRLYAAGLVDFPTSIKMCKVSVTDKGHAWLAAYAAQQQAVLAARQARAARKAAK